MDIGLLALGIGLMMMGIHWSMKRGLREERERRIAGLQRPAQAHARGLHCPHCGHEIDDADFRHEPAPFVPPSRRDSPYFRRDGNPT
ncbi:MULTISPECIES: hypothetical protein [Paraburkholderia]|uniref:hypothetical protein n=1 Tax=Paraburkholderia TaxID=1822464 RepID=UPI002252B4D2|nr:MULTISPECIES: hypothetical protein [Paraburkholderia]MCX4157440.1 hypothetical protein [Paraburkholderia aspalathi]MDN7166844.1 hypothetical protein [Paraburkholderia sp. SECH2]MDQ6395330.1 hypothetical protein [Paraburkholderia aspalathi]